MRSLLPRPLAAPAAMPLPLRTARESSPLSRPDAVGAGAVDPFEIDAAANRRSEPGPTEAIRRPPFAPLLHLIQ